MSEHEWKPGDVAMVEAFWRHGIVQAEGAVRREDGWVSLLDGSYKPTGGEIKGVRPLVVIDPEDRSQAERLAKLFMDQPEFGKLTEDADDMQAALRALANPTPEPLPEPTDPAVRVLDRDGKQWARVGNGQWAGEAGYWRGSWQRLNDTCGPLRIVTPDAPTPDADRPLQPGERVRIADNAVWIDAAGNKRVSPGRGRTGRIVALLGDPTDHALVRLDTLCHSAHSGRGSDVRITDLTRIEADA